MRSKPFEILVNWHHFIENHLKSGQKCLDFEWSSFQMVGTIAKAIAKAQPFEIQPSKSLDLKWSDFRSPLYLCSESKCVQTVNSLMGVPKKERNKNILKIPSSRVYLCSTLNVKQNCSSINLFLGNMSVPCLPKNVAT